MEMLSKYKKQLSELMRFAEKMENGELTISELSELEVITREIHERSVILKYKAYEARVRLREESVQEIEIDPVVGEEAKIEGKEEERTEDASIEFSLFGNTEEEAMIETTAGQQTEYTPEIEDVPLTEKIGSDESLTQVQNETIHTSSEEIAEHPFADQVKIPDDAILGFGAGKITSLSGSFGLNQRLRYINDLFDGSSDLFGSAVGILDSQNSMDDAKSRINDIAKTHNWNPESETVIEFMTMIKRRYA